MALGRNQSYAPIMMMSFRPSLPSIVMPPPLFFLRARDFLLECRAMRFKAETKVVFSPEGSGGVHG